MSVNFEARSARRSRVWMTEPLLEFSKGMTPYRTVLDCSASKISVKLGRGSRSFEESGKTACAAYNVVRRQSVSLLSENIGVNPSTYLVCIRSNGSKVSNFPGHGGRRRSWGQLPQNSHLLSSSSHKGFQSKNAIESRLIVF